MKIISLLLASMILSACSSSGGFIGSDVPYGYKSYDPCIACGENWRFYPNEDGGAQRQAREWYGFEWGETDSARVQKKK